MVQDKFFIMKNCKKMYWAYWKKPKLNKNRNETFHVDITSINFTVLLNCNNVLNFNFKQFLLSQWYNLMYSSADLSHKNIMALKRI